MMKQLFIIYPLLALLLITGCVNLKQVSDFATASSKGVAKYQRLPYSFSQNCMANCRENDIKTLALNANACDCTLAVQADSVDDVLYNAIQSYLDGLAALADGNLTVFKYDGLTGELQSGKVGGINISPEQAGAYAKLAGVISDAAVNGYRKNKLKQYIRAANPSFIILTEGLRFNITGSLVQVAISRRVKLKGEYNHLLNDTTNSGYEKRQIIKEYYRETEALDKALNLLNTYGKLLTKIGGDHDKLCKHMDDIDARQTALMIAGYISEIKDIDRQITIILK